MLIISHVPTRFQAKRNLVGKAAWLRADALETWQQLKKVYLTIEE